MTEIRRKKPVPFEFILELLESARPYTKPMFGCTAVYVDDRIVLILRQRDSFPEDNGVWLATSAEHHSSLREHFPTIRSIACFGVDRPTAWQVLPADEVNFEESANAACELILKGDPRIGRVPASRKKAQRKTADPAEKRKATAKSVKQTTIQISRKFPAKPAATTKAKAPKKKTKQKRKNPGGN